MLHSVQTRLLFSQEKYLERIKGDRVAGGDLKIELSLLRSKKIN